MKFFPFLQHRLRGQRVTGTKIMAGPVGMPTAAQAPTLRELSADSDSDFFTHRLAHRTRCLAKQCVHQIRNVVARATAFMVPPPLSLAEAAHILEAIRQQPRTPENITLQHKAFARLHHFLQQQPASLQAGPLQPLLMLLASCLARLPDLQQRSQALALIEMTLSHTPQLALAETLTMQLWGLSGSLIPRAFDAIDGFLQHRSADPRLQIDILLELTEVMQIPSCHHRAKALVRDGLQRLDTAPCLRKRIESRLGLSNIGTTGSR